MAKKCYCTFSRFPEEEPRHNFKFCDRALTLCWEKRQDIAIHTDRIIDIIKANVLMKFNIILDIIFKLWTLTDTNTRVLV